MKSYGKFTSWLIVVWFASALFASAMHVFQNNSNRIGLAVAVGSLAPILIFAVWAAFSSGFRQFALSLNSRILTLAHSWRIMGVVFVILKARGVLPAIFALPAGYGDMAIGATAALVALKLAEPTHRTSFILWQALGMADLVMAVGLGTTAGLINPSGVPMGPMTVLPLSLVPTFLVPLFFIFHVICIAQARANLWTPGLRSRGKGSESGAASRTLVRA
ncbi:MAG: hypothetical protein LAO03_06430 [Acidobacteriia bacterium]|nr:hypothetical protein [Terriglobia bacterium]